MSIANSAPPLRLTAEQAASEVLKLAQQAASLGTFGVGGIMVDQKGQIVATVINQVIRNNRLADPTAHAERQLLTWYYDNSKKLALPPPNELTIISSLDPCMMCAGACLQTGIRVVSISMDSYAGISGEHPGDFVTKYMHGLEHLHAKAERLFGYFGLEGNRRYQGSAGLFAGDSISQKTHDAAVSAFTNSMDKIRNSINADEKGINHRNPRHDTSIAKAQALKHLGEFCAFPALDDNTLPFGDRELARVLVETATAAQNSGARYDATALLDPFGNVLMVCGDNTHENPLQTSLFQLCRAYTAAHVSAPMHLQPYLPHPKYCDFVSLNGPDLQHDAERSLMNIGVLGASIEGSFQGGHWTYVNARSSDSNIQSLCANLPPLYQSIGAPVQAAKELQALVQSTRSEHPYAPPARVLHQQPLLHPGVLIYTGA